MTERFRLSAVQRHYKLWGRILWAGVILSKFMQWRNSKPKGEAMSKIHKGRQEALASLYKIHEKTKQNKKRDLGETQWTKEE